jgi:hypothetical protein
MSDPGIGNFVRQWLHYINLATTSNTLYIKQKSVADDYEKKIITTLKKQAMSHATIQISDGHLKIINKTEPNQLTVSKITELLHEYFKHKPQGGKDETNEIIQFIHANRGIKSTETIQRLTYHKPTKK